MEEVRTSIEKIFDSYEASNQDRSHAKRLNYSLMNDSRECESNRGRMRCVLTNFLNEYFDLFFFCFQLEMIHTPRMDPRRGSVHVPL